MKQKTKIFISAIAVVLILVIGFFLIKNEVNKKHSDANKFKEAYESLNDTIRESDGEKYNNVQIDSDNPIKYVDTKEALDVLNEKQAILYIGANWCPWCRNAVPVLFDVAKKYNVDTIYYLELDNEKSNFKIQDGKAVETNHGTETYYELLKKLDSILEEYTLTDEKGKTYKTGEKRIYMPFVVAIKDGEVINSHVGTVDLDKGQTKYDALTEEQRLKLNAIYSDMFVKTFIEPDNTCNDEACE